MTLDLGPIKERAENANLLSGVDPSDALALVAEVEALRAALGAEREARDDIAKRHLEVADKIDAGDSEDEDYDSGVQDGLVIALEAIDARRAPKIGGGE